MIKILTKEVLIMEIIFKYGKCVFTRPSIDNLDAMLEMVNDKEIAEMIVNDPMDFTREMEIKWINEHQDDNTFSVLDSNTFEYIGNCGFNEIKDNRGEIGVIIRKEMQGKKYAKDIIRGLIDYGFNVLGLDEIYSIVFSNNIRSINCVKELGFEEYDRVKNVVERNGNPVDDVYYRLKK